MHHIQIPTLLTLPTETLIRIFTFACGTYDGKNLHPGIALSSVCQKVRACSAESRYHIVQLVGLRQIIWFLDQICILEPRFKRVRHLYIRAELPGTAVEGGTDEERAHLIWGVVSAVASTLQTLCISSGYRIITSPGELSITLPVCPVLTELTIDGPQSIPLLRQFAPAIERLCISLPDHLTSDHLYGPEFAGTFPPSISRIFISMHAENMDDEAHLLVEHIALRCLEALLHSIIDLPPPGVKIKPVIRGVLIDIGPTSSNDGPSTKWTAMHDSLVPVLDMSLGLARCVPSAHGVQTYTSRSSAIHAHWLDRIRDQPGMWSKISLCL